MTQTDNLTEPNHPEQPGNAWVRSTFYGLATRTVVVRCPLCHRHHAVRERVAEQAATAPGPSTLVRDGDDDLRRGEDRSGQDNLAGYPDPADLVRGPGELRTCHPY